MRPSLGTLRVRTQVYMDSATQIRATWASASPPGWPQEGGWLAFGGPSAPYDDTDFVIYLDRENALRLQKVVNDLVAGMDTAGPVFEGFEVHSP